MRSIVVAAIGGLVVGHILWLIAISVATSTMNVNRWVLVVSAIFVALGIAALLLGSRFYQRRSQVWAAFLWCLPISPILLTIAVLGVTYL